MFNLFYQEVAKCWKEPLDLQLLRTLRERYAFTPSLRLIPMRKGLNSQTWFAVGPGGKQMALRRYPYWMDELAIRYEHSILHHIRKHGFPVPGVMLTNQGETFIEEGGHFYAFFEYHQGVAFVHPLQRKLRPHFLESAARMLARYHQLMNGFSPNGREIEEGWDFRWCLNRLADCRQTVASRRHLTRYDRYVLQQIDEIECQLQAVGTLLEENNSSYSKVVIHGDFGPSHVLFQKGQIVSVLDFGSAHFNARLADVAYALISFSKWFGSTLDLPMARRFLQAYQESNPLIEKEFEFLPLWMKFDRLKGLWWDLVLYYEQGRVKSAYRFAQNLKLLRWIATQETKLRALGKE